MTPEILDIKTNSNYKNKPLISVITVVFNGEKYLEKTIRSIINQTYKNIEYIIIDGGSSDGTIDIIKKYEDNISYWISEKDSGIYDAMNKGIDVASGKWINFMNAGDVFREISIIGNIFNTNESFKDIEVIYGDFEIDYGKFTRVVEACDLKKMWKGMVFSHQSSFIRSEYHKKYKYSLNYNIAGDFEFFYNTFKKNKKFKYISNIISIMDVNGLSDGNRFQSIYQMHQIINGNVFSMWHNAFYLYLYIDQFMRQILKIILPETIINRVKINK